MAGLNLYVALAYAWLALCSYTSASGAFTPPTRVPDGVIVLNSKSIGPKMTVPAVRADDWSIHPNSGSSAVPVVMSHGMGDSCFNPGMDSITKAVGMRAGSYSVCIGDGVDQESDTVGGFFTTLYAAVDFFAKEVRENAKLKQGFNAMGFSQGNNVIRGYMEKYNDPPVLNFISVHGPLAGTGSLPRCPPSTPLVGRLCRLMTELVAEAAYSDLVQRHVFQANYLRDPLNIAQFRRKCTWLADMNGECRSDEEHKQLALVYKTNFIRTKKMLLVRAMRDTMIFPSMSEWFGAYEDGGYDRVLSMNETEWYKRDSFGLRTMFERGAISFSTTQGDHLDFSEAELMSWVDLLFVVKR